MEYSQISCQKFSKKAYNKDTTAYVFYWKLSEWEPYSFEIQLLLNKNYLLYLEGSLSTVNLPPPLNNYYIDFEKKIQISNDQSKIRLIKIELVSSQTQIQLILSKAKVAKGLLKITFYFFIYSSFYKSHLF